MKFLPSFFFTSKATIMAVLLLIFVGGVVRSTGSGMGCPDWPKCFGSWVPPTHVSQLPLNYQEIYGAKLKGEVVFNPVKTWIEYLNRLLGVIIGILVFSNFVASFSFLSKIKSVVFLSGLAFALTLLEGWIGAKVVATELGHTMINVHLGIALLIVFVLVSAYILSKDDDFKIKAQLPLYVVGLVWLLTLVQLFFGTEVRGAIDTVSKSLGETQRGTWVESIGLKFYIHRSYSIIILVGSIWLYKKVKDTWREHVLLKQLNSYLLVFMFLEIVLGISLTYLGFQAWMQPFHLLFAVIMVTIQYVFVFINLKAVVQ